VPQLTLEPVSQKFYRLDNLLVNFWYDLPSTRKSRVDLAIRLPWGHVIRCVGNLTGKKKSVCADFWSHRVLKIEPSNF
jgi:hypothetical protein